MGHIFNDANKRTAYTGALVTLEVNDVRTDEIDQIGLEQAIIAAARGDLEVEDFVGAFQKLV